LCSRRRGATQARDIKHHKKEVKRAMQLQLIAQSQDLLAAARTGIAPKDERKRFSIGVDTLFFISFLW
jgi:hypothetical protein